MNIDTMTYGELKQIAALFNATQSVSAPHPMIGKHVLVRCYSAGVHTGELVSLNGDEAILKNSRRLWSWTAKEGVALSGVAIHGLKAGKVDVMLPEIALTGVIEVIPTSDKSRESINGS